MKSFREVVFAVLSLVMFALPAADVAAESMSVRFVTYNVNFGTSDANVDADMQKVKDKADVIMLQETKNVNIDNILGSWWTVHQVMNDGPGKRNAALAIRNSAVSQILATGLEFGVDNDGEQMHDRYITWADIKLNNGLTIRVMSIHMPPPRFERLQPPMADNIVDFVNSTPYPVIVGGDWNFNINADQYNIEGRTGLLARGPNNGSRIDGFYYDDTVMTETAFYRLAGLNVHSDHNPVQLVTDVVPVENIVDNSDSGFTASANWSTGTSASDKYGSNYRYHLTEPDSDTATWDFNVPYTGDYEIYAWWSQGANRSSTAPYIMPDSATVYKNQQANGGSWQSLGIVPLASGSHQVGLSCWTSNGSVVIGDAIKIYPR